MRYIPFSQGDTFELVACPNTTRSGTIIQVMECNAPDSSFLKGMGKYGDRLIYNRAEEADAKASREVLSYSYACLLMYIFMNIFTTSSLR